MVKGDYKIYYNDSFVSISTSRGQSKENFDKVFLNEKETKDFIANPAILFDERTNLNILALAQVPQGVISELLKGVHLVVAGGGIVTNERDELLLIYRRGKWDLPKGKIEPGESISQGALREVEEETGVRIKRVSRDPVITYHAYKLKGKNCIKETSWFEMRAERGQKDLKPQTEEDIDEVRWVKKEDLGKYREKCYLLIWDLIRAVKF